MPMGNTLQDPSYTLHDSSERGFHQGVADCLGEKKPMTQLKLPPHVTYLEA